MYRYEVAAEVVDHAIEAAFQQFVPPTPPEFHAVAGEYVSAAMDHALGSWGPPAPHSVPQSPASVPLSPWGSPRSRRQLAPAAKPPLDPNEAVVLRSLKDRRRWAFSLYEMLQEREVEDRRLLQLHHSFLQELQVEERQLCADRQRQRGSFVSLEASEAAHRHRLQLWEAEARHDVQEDMIVEQYGEAWLIQHSAVVEEIEGLEQARRRTIERERLEQIEFFSTQLPAGRGGGGESSWRRAAAARPGSGSDWQRREPSRVTSPVSRASPSPSRSGSALRSRLDAAMAVVLESKKERASAVRLDSAALQRARQLAAVVDISRKVVTVSHRQALRMSPNRKRKQLPTLPPRAHTSLDRPTTPAQTPAAAPAPATPDSRPPLAQRPGSAPRPSSAPPIQPVKVLGPAERMTLESTLRMWHALEQFQLQFGFNPADYERLSAAQSKPRPSLDTTEVLSLPPQERAQYWCDSAVISIRDGHLGKGKRLLEAVENELAQMQQQATARQVTEQERRATQQWILCAQLPLQRAWAQLYRRSDLRRAIAHVERALELEQRIHGKPDAATLANAASLRCQMDERDAALQACHSGMQVLQLNAAELLECAADYIDHHSSPAAETASDTAPASSTRPSPDVWLLLRKEALQVAVTASTLLHNMATVKSLDAATQGEASVAYQAALSVAELSLGANHPHVTRLREASATIARALASNAV